MIANLNNLPAPQFKELLRNAQDLEQLKIFTQDQSATRLCVDSSGHLWTQKVNVNFLIYLCQLISCALFERPFSDEEDKVNFLVGHIQEILNESLENAFLYGMAPGAAAELKKRLDKNTFTNELEVLKNGQTQVRQILSDHSLTPNERSERLGQVQLLSNLAECFTIARECLLLPLSANPVIKQPVVCGEPIDDESVVVGAFRDEPQVEKVALLAQIVFPEPPTIASQRPLTNYFKEVKKMTTQLFRSAEPTEIMLKKKMDALVLNPTFENREKLKGILAGTIDYYLSVDCQDEKQRAVDFGNIVASKILTLYEGPELISELISAENRPFIHSLTLGGLVVLIKNYNPTPVQEQIQPVVDFSNEPLFEVEL